MGTSLIVGESVIVEHHANGSDENGYNVSSQKEAETVDDVLFEPRRTGIGIDQAMESIDSSTYNVTFHFPVSYDGELGPGDIIVYHSRKFRVMSRPLPYQVSPLPWNMQVDAKSLDG